MAKGHALYIGGVAIKRAMSLVAQGCKVQLVGLRARPELNGQVGTIVKMPTVNGRFLVDLGGASACSQLVYSQRVGQTCLQPPACSQQLVSVKAENLKLGLRSRKAVANTTGLVRTWWNSDEKSSFVQRNTAWCIRSDPQGMRQCNDDLWLYLRMTLERRLQTYARRGPGQAGHEWLRFLGDPTTRPFCCAMYTQAGWGEMFQMQPLAQPGVYNEPDCTWWPCLAVPPASCSTSSQVATYCPGLSFGNARPWYANQGRVIWLDLDNLCGDDWQWVHFGDLGLQPEGPVETPGLVIEEVVDSDGDGCEREWTMTEDEFPPEFFEDQPQDAWAAGGVWMIHGPVVHSV